MQLKIHQANHDWNEQGSHDWNEQERVWSTCTKTASLKSVWSVQREVNSNWNALSMYPIYSKHRFYPNALLDKNVHMWEHNTCTDIWKFGYY